MLGATGALDVTATIARQFALQTAVGGVIGVVGGRAAGLHVQGADPRQKFWQGATADPGAAEAAAGMIRSATGGTRPV